MSSISSETTDIPLDPLVRITTATCLCTEPMAQQRERLGIVGHGPVLSSEQNWQWPSRHVFALPCALSGSCDLALRSSGPPASPSHPGRRPLRLLRASTRPRADHTIHLFSFWSPSQ